MQQGRLGRGVARLEDDGVARGERRRDLPDRHHHRVVPRRDLADDADRLAADPRGVARHVLARGRPSRHAGRAGEEPDLVHHRRQLLAGGQGVRLAGVLGLERDKLVGAPLDRVGELQQRLLPLARGGSAPGLEGLGRGGVGRVDVAGGGHRRRGHDLGRHGTDDVASCASVSGSA